MTKRISEEEIQDIRAKSDIVDVISRYISVEKKGKDYKAVCPFHDDHDPSLSISIDRQIYKCFVCNAGGNVFGFVKDFENISFPEAVVKVGSYIHIDLSDRLVQAKPVNKEHQTWVKIMDEALNFMHYQLKTAEGENYLKFLESRGYQTEIIEKFKLGAALSGSLLTEFLLAKGYQITDLIKLGLSKAHNESYLDVFYDRVVFPIYDRDGHCIAFSARTIHANNDVKYVNTADTPLYIKGNNLYNYHFAKNEAIKSGFVLVVEGVTDVLAYEKIGMSNVVATLGTACTNQQLSMIKQCSRHIVLSYDGDKAGMDANYKIGKMLIEMKCDVEICYNIGLDPDEVIKTYGVEHLRNSVKNRISWIEFCINYATLRYGVDSYQNRKNVLDFMVEHLKGAERIDQRTAADSLAKILGFNTDDIFARFAQSGQQITKTYEKYRSVYKSKAPQPLAYLEVLNQISLSKHLAFKFRNELGFLPSEDAEELALMLLDEYREKDEIALADLLSKNLSEPIKNILLYLGNDFLTEVINESILNENMDLVRVYMIDLQIKQLKQQADLEIDVLKKSQIGLQIVEKQRERRTLIQKED